jgi:hypothetical protein
MNDEYKELAESVAADLLPIMIQFDMLNLKYKLDDLKQILGKMRHHHSMLDAWPFPETMRKAEVMKAQTDTFEAFVILLEVRQKQLAIQREPDLTPGQEVLRAMGLL